MGGEIQIHTYMKHGIVVHKNRVIGLIYLGPLMRVLSQRLVLTVDDKSLYALNLPPYLNKTWAKLNENSAIGILYLDPDPASMNLLNDIAKVLIHNYTPKAKRYPLISRNLNFTFYGKTDAYKLISLNDLITWGGIPSAPDLSDVARAIIKKLGVEKTSVK